MSICKIDGVTSGDDDLYHVTEAVCDASSRPTRPDESDNLYVLQSIIGGPVRLGRACDPDALAARLQMSSPFPLSIVRAYHRQGDLEAAAHAVLKSVKLHDDWFDERALEILDGFIGQDTSDVPFLNPPAQGTAEQHDMTFDQLRLLCAIHRAGLDLQDPVTDKERLSLGMAVQRTYADLFDTTYFPWRTEQIVKLFYQWRKSPDTRTKADIAAAHGCRCFWTDRAKGPCCDQAEAGHLVPRCQHGKLSVANCVIECRAHNNQRRERTIEQYLLSPDRTTHR